MPTKLEMQWSAQVFKTLVTDTKQRLARGSQLRKEMLAALEAGERPKGYRPDWIHSAAKAVIRLLTKIASKFNDRHKTDQASVDDLLDILATASELLRNQATKPRTSDSGFGSKTKLPS